MNAVSYFIIGTEPMTLGAGGGSLPYLPLYQSKINAMSNNRLEYLG